MCACPPLYNENLNLLARACGVPVGRRSGGRLAMTLVATINVIIFFCQTPLQLAYPTQLQLVGEGVDFVLPLSQEQEEEEEEQPPTKIY